MSRTISWSKTVTFFEGDWHEGNVPIMGVRTHAAWLCTSVFDGARAFEGVAPDIDLHCARVNESAKVMSLKPLVSTETWMGLVGEGRKRFDRDAELYIRPMYWAEDAAAGAVRPDPETTRWCLTLYVVPLPKPTGTAITLSPFRRPTRESAPVDAKAGCLYPEQCARLDRGALARLRQLSDVRHARQCRRTRHRQYLHGQGRRRVHAGGERHLPLRHHPRSGSSPCCARPASPSSRRCCAIPISNPLTRFSPRATSPRSRPSPGSTTRSLQPGPFYRRARELYWEFAHAGP